MERSDKHDNKTVEEKNKYLREDIYHNSTSKEFAKKAYTRRYGNIVLFGSAHVSKKTEELVNKLIDDLNPKIVCLELDDSRAKALFEEKKQGMGGYIKNFGIKGFFLYLLSKYQYDIALRNDTEIGLEMKTAIKKCSKENIPLSFIDIPISQTFSDLKKALNIRFGFKVLKEMFSGKKVKLSKTEDFIDLKEHEIDQITSYMKKSFPDLWKIILDRRNKYMAKQLHMLENVQFAKQARIEGKEDHFKTTTDASTGINFSIDNRKIILAIVGKAHVKGIIEELKKLDSQSLILKSSST